MNDEEMKKMGDSGLKELVERGIGSFYPSMPPPPPFGGAVSTILTTGSIPSKSKRAPYLIPTLGVNCIYSFFDGRLMLQVTEQLFLDAVLFTCIWSTEKASGSTHISESQITLEDLTDEEVVKRVLQKFLHVLAYDNEDLIKSLTRKS